MTVTIHQSRITRGMTGRPVWKMSIMLFLTQQKITQPEIDTLVGGIDYSAVSRARSRLQKRLEGDHKLKQIFNDLGDQLFNLSRVKI